MTRVLHWLLGLHLEVLLVFLGHVALSLALANGAAVSWPLSRLLLV